MSNPTTPATKPAEDGTLAFYRLDEVAECFDTSKGLYRKLWEVLGDLSKEQKTEYPAHEDNPHGNLYPGEVDYDRPWNVRNNWARFSPAEQEELLAIEAREKAELAARWEKFRTAREGKQQ